MSKNTALLAISFGLLLVLGLLFASNQIISSKIQETGKTVAPNTQTIVDDDAIKLNQTISDIEQILTNKYNLTDAHYVQKLSSMIAIASIRENVPYEIIISVMKVESNFDPQARNGNSIGYMQVKSNIWQKEIPYNIHEPQGNILSGAYVLRKYHTETKNWSGAIKAYNIGITDFKRGARKETSIAYHTKVYFQLKQIIL